MLRPLDTFHIKHQQGAVLLVLAVLISVISLGWVYAGMSGHRNADALTSKALTTAKAALIGRAYFDTNHPGSLPCPDINNDGISETTVGVSGGNCPNYIGRLPWRTLALTDIRDSNGERLWYVLSSDARDYQYLPINSKSVTGLLQVDGSAHQVAVIFAPGLAISPQQRGDQTQQNSVGNYLEGENANGDNLFVSQFQADPAFNDKLKVLSSANVFRKVERLVLQQIAASLTQYQSKNQLFPYAADQSGNSQTNLVSGYIPYKTLTFTSTVLAENKWFDALAISPTLPYIVSVTRDNVQVNLQYCQGTMTLNTAMVVKCV